ncbi:hypothetical protein ACN47E_008764 [Coniothyrium glycines]
MEAHSQKGAGVVSPTGLVLHEPNFPNIGGDPSEPIAHKPEGLSRTLAVESPPTMSPQTDAYDPHSPKDTSHSHGKASRSDLTRPMQQRWATERPKPSVRHSLLGRAQPYQGEKRPAPPERAATVTFDPYSSASDSDSDSSSDEKRFPKQTLGHGDEVTRQEKQKRRRSTAGPFSRFKVANEHFRTQGRVSKADGRLKLSILEKDIDSGYIAKALGAVLKKHPRGDEQSVRSYDESAMRRAKIAPEDDEMENDSGKRIRLNIVIIIIGSRGDIQPFIRIGKILQEDYGHRVRLATHPAFKDFVENDCGLEFFSVGGNPAELMAFMVKNPGLIPNIDTIKDGEIGRRRAQMYEMFQGMWRACINATDDETDETNAKMMGEKEPFVADAIIANPPSFAPQHIAEKLGIPLHMMFTFPYTPTSQFPHPLANIKVSNVEATYSNFMSYPLVEMMMWQGLGDLINRFRTEILHMEGISTLWAPGQLYRMKVPYTYMWSPGLIPKPKDWGPEIDISGFVFLDLASSFTPPDDLKQFLDGGDPPVYIGFGSIVVDDPDEFTKLIFEAIKIVGCRALVSKGWGGFGSNADCPDNIFMLENTPHDWLFPRCSAVVHHGGAGTTAIGLKCAKPTMIVPFFGDQPFWGAMVSKAKAGAHECIPYKKLNAERLAEGIQQCLTDEAKKNVKKIAQSIEKEGDGALNAVRSFHRSLPLQGEGSMRCDLLDDRTAVWKIKNTNVKLSALAADILVERKKLKWNELRLIRHYEWNDFGGPGEPITGVWGSLMSSMTDAATGVGGVPLEMTKSIRKREKMREKKRRIQRRNEQKKLAASDPSTISESGKVSQKDSKLGPGHQSKQGNGSRPQASREESTLSKITEPETDLAQELGHEAAFGFRKTGGALARLPMNLTLAITQGFHNAPRLYGDETVRRPPRVTGVHSGLRAGRDELLYGVMDGVTGIVTQPYHGAKNHGVIGAVKGIGFGLGGFVLKDIAALLGPMAYTMKGLNAEYMKRYQPTHYIRRARIAQGQKELQSLEIGSRAVRIAENEQGKEKKSPMKRDQVEENVSMRWQALQKIITEDKKTHKSGAIAAITGQGEKKEGQRVGRKSTEVAKWDTKAAVPKSKTVPIAELEKRSGTSKKAKKGLDGDKSRASVDARLLNRSTTAPITTLEQNKNGSREALSIPQAAERHEPSETSKPNARDTKDLGDLQAVAGTRNKSDPELISPNHEQDQQHLSAHQHINDDRRASADANSEDTKVETEPADWPTTRQKAEGHTEGGPTGRPAVRV